MAGSENRINKSKAVKGGVAATMVALSSLSIYKAVAATATLPIIARIVRAIEVTVNTSLDFGTIALTENMAATANLDPLTNNLRFSGKGGISLAGGVPTAGKVTIRGAALPVHVSMETNNLRITNGETYMTIADFNFNTPLGGNSITVTPGGSGNSAQLIIGATLKAREMQMTGTYLGANTIFANYQ